MVECSYVIQIFLKNQDDTGTFIASPSHLLSFALVIFLGSLLLSLPFVQAETSQATYFDHSLYDRVHGLCDRGSFYPAGSLYLQYLGPVDLHALDPDRWIGSHDLYRNLLYPRQAKLSLRGRETIQESFSYGETQSLKDFIRSILLTTFLVEGIGAFLLSFRFIPEFGWGRGILTSIFWLFQLSAMLD